MTPDRLPLFRISFTVLGILLGVSYIAELYNVALMKIGQLHDKVEMVGDSLLTMILSILVNTLQKIPIPSQLLVAIFSSLFLLVAVGIYQWKCHPTVKAFSGERWSYELGRELIHYWPLTWKDRGWRLTCISTYLIGSMGVAIVITYKFWEIVVFVWKTDGALAFL